MSTRTRLARLARLEALETATRFPIVIEMHDCTPVAANDRRRGSYVIEQGNQISFFCASASEYEAASAAYATDRDIVLITVDSRCIDFTTPTGREPPCALRLLP